MKAAQVLSAVPYNEWVTAGELSEILGLSSHKVACVIREHLLFTKKVERRRIRNKNGVSFHYRRILWL